MIHWELIWRYLTGGGRFVGWTSLLAFFGVVIGVASLVLTMGVISGVESLLKKSIIDVSGHFLMLERSGPIAPLSEMKPKLEKILPDMESVIPYIHQEGMVAHKGKIRGISIQGVDAKEYAKVLKLNDRVITGKIDLENSGAVIGKVLADRLQLKVGDDLKVVVARPSQTEDSDFSPEVKDLRVSAILDMGKFELNERVVIANADDVFALKGFKQGDYSGYLFRFKTDESARTAAFKVGQALGYSYFMKDWFDVNRNFFSAVEVEKYAIFVVLLFLVIIACFNICSTLFVHVLKRYSDISVMKTMGASPRFLVLLFVKHGLIVGTAGAVLGVLVGLGLAFVVEHASLVYIPAEIYKFGQLAIEIRASDLALILGSTIFLCFLSTLLPAIKGAKMSPVEGLRYD
ncbi:MAG: ABC transporter permease [Bdellovibrionales bacterium]|nr:ABC transporter permease [Bdellovibrionales bacterium]